MKYLRVSLLGLGLSATASMALAQAPPKITTTKEAFGFRIGDDYRLANYTQFTTYMKKLDAESDRMTLQSIGKTAEGREQYMAIITTPANHKLLAKYQGISQRLAHAEGLTDDQAKALAAEGKAVVWIDGGLHATEVLGAAQLIETVYQLVSRTDAETMNILNNCIILAVHANPDGMELVSNWYMKESDEKKRNSNDIPRLYQKYIGHDNNRDFYMANQPESQNMLRQLFVEWNPQIMYNHHQTGPTGAVMFAPPFRDPFNYNFDPMIPVELDLVGAAMHSRFEAEGKPGVTMRKGANYSTWWNGGLRTSVYFHNGIGLLTESIGNPTPVEIEFVPQRMLPNADMPLPITPQIWHFRQSIEYSITANWAVLDLAARMKDTFLYRMYQKGKNSIERGSKDHWTFTPHEVEGLQAKIAREMRNPAAAAGAPGGFAASMGGRAASVPTKYFDELKDPAKRDPRGYIIPSNQPDFPTAVKFVKPLIHNGITIHRATKEFTVKGKTYPAGSLVVKAAQAFRPHVMDMFEPQDHPNDFASPGGPPIPPYDNAGWTLAFQMGVQFDRILDGFEGPFEAIPPKVFAKPLPAEVSNAATAAGFVLPAAENDSFVVVNRLLKAGVSVERMTSGPSIGAFYVTANAAATPILQKAATDLGVPANGVASKPAGDTKPLKSMRIGLADTYGGSMTSGWTRWLLEQFEFATVDQVFPQQIDAGNLNAKYDVLIFTDEVLPEADAPAAAAAVSSDVSLQKSARGDFKNRLGRYTVAKSVPAIKAFMEAGGKVLTVGSSTAIGEQLGFVDNHLVEKTATGEKKLSREKYYVPGSVLRAEINPAHPLAWGMPKDLDVFFDNSPVFELHPDASLKGVTPVAWFPNAEPLRSGWAWGQHYIAGGVSVAEATVGQGRLMMFGPEITFRGQPHGTFKFLFNGIYR